MSIAMKNNSNLAQIMRKLAPLLSNEYIELMATNSAWNIILGVLPDTLNGYEQKIMEQNRMDTSAEKIDNITRITSYAEYFLNNKPDFSLAYVESFSQAIAQLVKYTSGDKKAEDSLRPLKNLYISFMTSYYIKSVQNATVRSVTINIRDFSEIISVDDYELAARLNDIIS